MHFCYRLYSTNYKIILKDTIFIKKYIFAIFISFFISITFPLI